MVATLAGISLSACGPGAPKQPEITIHQPIINQTFCDTNNQNCVVKSLCRNYYRDVKTGQFIFVKDEDLSVCNGIFGVDATNFELMKEYATAVTNYIAELLNEIKNQN